MGEHHSLLLQDVLGSCCRVRGGVLVSMPGCGVTSSTVGTGWNNVLRLLGHGLRERLVRKEELGTFILIETCSVLVRILLQVSCAHVLIFAEETHWEQMLVWLAEHELFYVLWGKSFKNFI